MEVSGQNSRSSSAIDWPTVVLIFICHALWVTLVFYSASLNNIGLGMAGVLALILVVTLHSSLQHECLHGHPTSKRAFNELLVSLPIGLFIPYGRFRELHLKHHLNSRLTDPYDDPESWYITDADWQSQPMLKRFTLQVNATLLGRLIIGPPLSLWAFWRSDLSLMLAGNRSVLGAWVLHTMGVFFVLAILLLNDFSIWMYVLCVAYPAMSMLMVRTYAEHRAEENAKHRTAVVESGFFFSLLFLNNNLHAVHHKYPTLAWYTLPRKWQDEKIQVLADNNHYHFPGGYFSIARKWLCKSREPVVHPYVYKNPRDKD